MSNEKQATKRIISIYNRDNRISVKRNCLEEIGSPEYFVFLMQDDGKRAIIRPAAADDDDAIHVYPSCYAGKGDTRFAGKVLLGLIREKMGWDKDTTYQVEGEIMEHNMLLFDLNKAVIVQLTRDSKKSRSIAEQEEEDTTYFWGDTREEVLREDAQPTAL